MSKIILQLQERVVRMRAALSIVNGGHNEEFDSLVKKALVYWKSIKGGEKNSELERGN